MVFCLLFSAIAIVVYAAQGDATHLQIFYVSESGNDQGDGSAFRPWRNIDLGIFNAIEYMRKNPKTNVNLVVKDGKYPLRTTINMNGEGIEGELKIYAEHTGKAVLVGYKVIDNLKPLSDKYAKKKISKDTHTHVWQANLLECGIADLGTPIETDNRMDIYLNGVRQNLSRWPNEGFINCGEVLGKTKLAENVTKEGVFRYSEDHVGQLAKEKGVCMYGYWKNNWSETYHFVADVDTKQHIITLQQPYHSYGHKTGARYYVVNALSELDTPGEYYIDGSTGMLYWYAPDGFSHEEDTLTASCFRGEYILNIQNFNNLVVDGLSFVGGRRSAVKIEKGNACQISNCHISQMGVHAININKGKNHVIKGCLIEQIGWKGIIVNTGDRKTLENGGVKIHNNIIREYAQFKHTMQQAIQFNGCGADITHNYICHSYGPAMRINGNDVNVEYNVIEDVLHENDDQGAFDMWKDPSHRGIVIRFNYWKDICDSVLKQRAAIRLDDYISGVQIYGNVFDNCGSEWFGAVQIHGGKDNIIDNNVFYHCSAGVSFTTSDTKWKKGMETASVQKLMFKDVDINSLQYLKAYPELRKGLMTDVDKNVVKNNLMVNCRKDFFREKKKNTLQNNHLVQSSLSLDALLSKKTLKSFGLKAIPFDQIGVKENTYLR